MLRPRTCSRWSLAVLFGLLPVVPAAAQPTILHSFAYGPADGAQPYFGSLVQSGSMLFGTTGSGGSVNDGTIFRVGTDGTGFSLLHTFLGSQDGQAPVSSLIRSGSTLYGTTYWGGGYGDANGYGTVYKIAIDGTGFGTLHRFAGGPTDGVRPNGAPLVSGSTLYGMTTGGGSGNAGTICAGSLRNR